MNLLFSLSWSNFKKYIIEAEKKIKLKLSPKSQIAEERKYGDRKITIDK
ncbi:hypothetical protein IDH20_02350 [Pelagibacterales bacterium SAG-MED39]|nr:hypothetical protein [Pelagibacterales bacterium SAG-MED39]